MNMEKLKHKRESLVARDMKHKGYSVKKTQGIYRSGTPDLVCKKNNKEVFVEIKYDRDRLMGRQIEVIKELLSRKIEVWLTKISKIYEITYFKFKTEKEFEKFINPPKTKKHKCIKCQYEWYPRNPEAAPKECPECKSRGWNKR